MRLQYCRPAYKNPLVNKYLYDFKEVSKFFAYDPHNAMSFVNRSRAALKNYTMDREKLVGVLRKYNLSLGCGEKVLANIEKLLAEDSLMVITGQQPGVLTGPLYTVYKALTAIQLAESLSGKLSLPIVPVFWVGGEDHDFGEISHAEILTGQNRIERIRLETVPDRKISVGDIPITSDVYALIDQLALHLAASEFKESLLEKLRALAAASPNLGEWFARLMTWLMGEYGLIMVNPLVCPLKEMGVEIYKKFIRSADDINGAFRRGQDAVRTLGMEPQVEKEENSTHLFIYVRQERMPILYDGDTFYVRDRDYRWTRNELLHIMDQKPEIFSANVVLKPVFQDYIFPIAAYIAGPGEISYYALYKDIYSTVGREMPIIYPRANITLVEKNIGRYMEKYGLTLDDVQNGLDARLAALLREADEVGVEELFAAFKEKFRAEYGELIKKVALLEENLKTLGEENTGRIIGQIEHLESKARQQLRKKNEDAVRQFAKINYHLMPQGKLQERVYNIFQYLAKYGPGLIGQLMELPLADSFDHKLVYL